MVLHSLNIFLVLNLLALSSLSGLPSLFLIYLSSLDKILSEDRCCFRYSLSAKSSTDLQNRNLFPAFPLLSSMRKNSLCRSFKCFFWNIGGQLFYCIEFFTSIFLHKLASLTPQMSLFLTKLTESTPYFQKFPLCLLRTVFL